MSRTEAWTMFAAAALSNPRVSTPDHAIAEANYLLRAFDDMWCLEEKSGPRPRKEWKENPETKWREAHGD